MICTSCQKAEAVVFIKQIANNQVSQKALCSACAGHAEDPLNAASAFFELLSQLQVGRRKKIPASSCPECRTTLADFRTHGRLGCAACYEYFAPVLKNFIPRVHYGAYRHRGKSPA